MYSVHVNVTVIGLGKLGLPLAVLLARAGFFVSGYDKDPNLVRHLQDKSFSSTEEKLMEYLRGSSNLNFFSNQQEISEDQEIFFYIVPTPSRDDGSFSNSYLVDAIRETSGLIARCAVSNRITLNVVSTVMPGSCSGAIKDVAERETGLKSGQDFGICYNPEFIALGSVIHDMEYPDMHLIGSDDEYFASKVEYALRGISKVSVPVVHMTLTEAELVKIAVNNFITMKISFANGLMQLAENIGSIDINRVTSAIGLDSRIGRKYLNGAMPYGGPCFPRDTRALKALYKETGIENGLAQTVESVNAQHTKFITELLIAKTEGKVSQVGLIGVSYKRGTSVIEDSPSIQIGLQLISKGLNIVYWDDEGAEFPTDTNGKASKKHSLKELLQAVKVVLIARECTLTTHEWQELKEFTGDIVDPWRVLHR